METVGWHLAGDAHSYNLTQIDEQKHRDSTFYKEQWVALNGMKQRMIVSYSISYRNYQRSVRERQVNRAVQAINNGGGKLSKVNQNDYKRFVSQTHCTKEGEVSEKTLFHLNHEAIQREEAFDGFYAVCTTLEDDIASILRANKRRWEIEECFRIMKSEFKARPVYVSLDQRIKAHFLTCFLSLVIYRYLERRMDNKFTCEDMISQLRDMRFLLLKGCGYVPAYTRTNFTDALHEAFGFRTDYEIVTNQSLQSILRRSRSK